MSLLLLPRVKVRDHNFVNRECFVVFDAQPQKWVRPVGDRKKVGTLHFFSFFLIERYIDGRCDDTLSM